MMTFLIAAALALWLWLDLTIKAVFHPWAWLSWMIIQSFAIGALWSTGGLPLLLAFLGLAGGFLWGWAYHLAAKP